MSVPTADDGRPGTQQVYLTGQRPRCH